MTDTPSETHPETLPEAQTPADSAEILVGDVNTSFDPLEPEEIAPVVSDPLDATPPPVAEEREAGPPPPPLQAASDSSNQKLLGCLRDILLVLISVILGAAFALTILLGLNGTLFLNDRDKTTYLEVNLKTMQNRQEELEKRQSEQKDAIATTEALMQAQDSALQMLDGRTQALEEAQKRQVADIEALQARSDEIEQTADVTRQKVADIQTRQDDLADQVTGLDDQIGAIQDDIAKFEKTAARFDKFVTGLVALIAEVTPEEAEASAVVTATTPAASLPVTATVTMTPTRPAPPVATITPEGESSALELFPPTRPLPTPAAGRSIVFGLVWLDANENGVPDADETVLPGVRITLQDASGAPLLSMVTGADGRFAFINMPPGDYHLQVTPPANSSLNTPDVQAVTAVDDERVEINFGLTSP